MSKEKWKLENILCPECKDLAFITYNDETISLECKKCVKTINYSLSELIDMQYKSSILRCDECNSIINIYDDNNELYICSQCQCDKKLCSACKVQHLNKEKHIVDYKYNWKYKYCVMHGIPLVNYCNTCNCNFCKKEENLHGKHNYFLLQTKMPKENYIAQFKSKITELNSYIEKYKKELNILKIIFDRMINNMINNLDNHLILNNYFNKALRNLNNNYQTIKNLDGFAYNKTINNIKNFLDYKIKDKFKYLIDRFYSKNIPYNQIELSYTPKSNKKIELFNEQFVSQNKENCYLILQDKLINLCQFYEYNKKPTCDFKINFIACKPITDMKNMFYRCDSLKSFISYNFDTSKVNDMSNMFNECIYLISVKGIKDVSSVTSMNSMFKDCGRLTCIENISNWNLSKVKDISSMFDKCRKLTNLAEYLLWDTSNIINMSYLFSGCYSLKRIPDISSWNTDNVVDMSHTFQNCESITSLPDLSKWKLNKVTNISYMFEFCAFLNELPDISQWDTSNIIDMSGFLSTCESLQHLPNISKWNTSKVISMKEMFFYCKSLKYFPNISSWDTSKVNDISSMFFKCMSLKKVPDRSLFQNNIKDSDYDSFCGENQFIKRKTDTNK